MIDSTDIHPDAILDSLLAKGGRAQRRSNLVKVNELCRRRHQMGERDFTIPAIGRLIESEGIMKGRALYNAPSADYRALIEAWSAYAGPPVSKQPKALASSEFLMRIDDPAIRSIMQATITERDKLRAQLSVLKAHTQVVVDRRPLALSTPAVAPSQPSTGPSIPMLTPSEREALSRAISPDYLAERGLREGSHGEIMNERGRTIFEVGFARGIRKLLNRSNGAGGTQ